MSGPIFVGGLMRSGTTLLRAMLGRHPAVFAGLETHWFELDWPAGRARKGEPLEPYLERLAAFFDLPWAEVRPLAQGAADAESFLEAFMGLAARRAGKRRWAEKTPGNVQQARRIFARWPEARLIHIVRDPRDVFASFRRSGKYGGPADWGRLWLDTFATVERLKRELPLGPDRFHELRYEDLASAPEAAMRALLAFVGEPWDAACAGFEGQADDFDKVLRLTGHASTTLEGLRQPLNRDRMGIWRESIGEHEVEEAAGVAAAAGLGQLFAALQRDAAA